MQERSLAALTILVVDDEAFSRSVVLRMLRKLGFAQLHEAGDGEEAQDKLRMLPLTHALFLDFNMPKMNGLELLRRIRDGSAGVDRALPTAMLTGHRDMALVRTAMTLDVNAFICKPLTLDLLAERLRRMLRQKTAIKPAWAYADISLAETEAIAGVGGGGEAGGGGRGDHAASDPPPLGAVRAALERVPPGARLAVELRDEDGRTLLPRGAPLTAQVIATLLDLRSMRSDLGEVWISPSPGAEEAVDLLKAGARALGPRV